MFLLVIMRSLVNQFMFRQDFCFRIGWSWSFRIKSWQQASSRFVVYIQFLWQVIEVIFCFLCREGRVDIGFYSVKVFLFLLLLLFVLSVLVLVLVLFLILRFLSRFGLEGNSNIEFRRFSYIRKLFGGRKVLYVCYFCLFGGSRYR